MGNTIMSVILLGSQFLVKSNREHHGNGHADLHHPKIQGFLVFPQ